jgi:hypothetical protein
MRRREVLELLLTWAMLVHEITIAEMRWDEPDDPGCPDAPTLWNTTDFWLQEEL